MSRTNAPVAKETDLDKLRQGFLFVGQQEVVSCPHDPKHGQCDVFASQKGDLFHKCLKCIDEREKNKDGEDNKYFGTPGVIVCKDGEAGIDKRKRGGGKAAKQVSSGTASPDRGVEHVARRKLKDEMLLDLQKKTDMCYQMLLQLVKAPNAGPSAASANSVNTAQ